MMSTEKETSSRRSRKIAAIAAGALVVGVGATYTLASWNDSEWVWGGVNDGPGIGTSTFEVQQDTTSPFVSPGTFADFETNPGDELTFTTGALQLTPADTVYAPVALRTTSSSEAGDVTLQGAVAADGVTVNDASSLLWNAIRVSVYTATGATPPAECSSTGVENAGWDALLVDQPLGTAASTEQSLAASAGSIQHYCFAVTLPSGSSDTLQGRTIAPAWEFRSVSD